MDRQNLCLFPMTFYRWYIYFFAHGEENNSANTSIDEVVMALYDPV